jgi:uncharacterized protein (TIGR01777 family)
MTLVFSLLTFQTFLGALDTFWNHEYVERLPSRRGARLELALHAAREFVYVFLFLALAWREWHGAWALAVAGAFLVEVVITIWDFVVEDRTRRLPVFERVLHTVLTLMFGVVLMALAPLLFGWYQKPAAVVAVSYGGFSWLLTFMAAGMAAWGLRDAIAALRHFRPAEWLRHPIEAAERPSGRAVLITGATGFIGGHVVRALRRRGDSVWVWTRDADLALARFGPHVHVVRQLAEIPAGVRIDAIVNLAGAPVIGLPWTKKRRQLLIESRVKTTQQVLDWCAHRAAAPPRVMVTASAIGFYGPGGDEWLTEASPPQEVFQSKLCLEREAAANAAEAQGIRVVNLRIGLVLGRDGGIFQQLARPAKLGLAATIGNGLQWMSWIHITDMIRIIEMTLDEPRWNGPLNAVAPAPERQRDFQAALARACRRWHWLRIPGMALNLALGEMAQLLVKGQRVAPRRLLDAGFEFRHYTLASALRDLVPDPATPPHLRATNRDCQVWFNGDCPVCSYEIGGYEKLAQKRSLPIRFHDSIRVARPLAAYGLRREHMERRLYLLDEQGRMFSGFGAVLALWARMPGYRWLGRVFSLPPLRAVCEVLYDHIVAPGLAYWARVRQSGVRT